MRQKEKVETIAALARALGLTTNSRTTISEYKMQLRNIICIVFLVFAFPVIGCTSSPDIIPHSNRGDSELVAHLLKISSKRFYEGAPPISDEVFPFVRQKGYRSYREFLIDDGFNCKRNICIFTNLTYVDDSMTQINLNTYFIHIWMVEIKFDEVQTMYDVEVTQLSFMHRRVDD